MSTETVLSPEQIDNILNAFDDGKSLEEFARAIEQAVLQSPEVQGLIEALKWAVDNPDDSAYWIHQAKIALDAIRPQCRKCEGHGTVMVLSDSSPDADHIEIECPDCDRIHGEDDAAMEKQP